MPEFKRQHYVPKAYLRNFSWGDARAQIHLCVLKNGRLVFNADLAKQCYEDYFYGDDLFVEKQVMGPIDGRGGELISQMLAAQEAPKPATMDHHAFVVYSLFQYARTMAAAEAMDQQLDQFVKAVLKATDVYDEAASEAFITRYKSAVHNSLKIVSESIPLVMDLRCKVMRNLTDLQFITSDNPTVFYNQYAESRTCGSNTGLAAKGLQVFFPLSPRLLVVFYDERVYAIGHRRDRFADVREVGDVRQLNDLQWLNALETVYFNESQDRAEINRGLERNLARRSPVRSATTISKAPERDGTIEFLTQSSKVDHRVRLSLACVRQLERITQQEQKQAVAALRDPQRMEIFQEFRRELAKGTYKASDWNHFIADRLGLPRQG